MKKEKTSLPPGRPRAFDVEEALDKALYLFWHQGYEGTSLTDLTEAMGINRPSLYAAFGNKEALFHKALDRYTQSGDSYLKEVMSLPTARAAIEQLLLGAAGSEHSDSPRGCLLVKGALTGSHDSHAIQAELSARRAATEAAIRARLERAYGEGELPAEASPTDMARYFATVLHGLSVQAVGGATPEELARVAQMAMQSWPA